MCPSYGGRVWEWQVWEQHRARQGGARGDGYVSRTQPPRDYEAVQTVLGWRHAPREAVHGGDKRPLYQSIEYEVRWKGGTRTWEHGAHLLRESTMPLRKQLCSVSTRARHKRHSAWWEERRARGIAVTPGRPRAQEIRDFREWAQAGAPPTYVHPNHMNNAKRDCKTQRTHR